MYNIRLNKKHQSTVFIFFSIYMYKIFFLSSSNIKNKKKIENRAILQINIFYIRNVIFCN